MLHGKVLAQMVESTLIVWEDLGLSLMYTIVYYLIIIVFNNMIEHVEWGDNYRITVVITKHEFVN